MTRLSDFYKDLGLGNVIRLNELFMDMGIHAEFNKLLKEGLNDFEQLRDYYDVSLRHLLESAREINKLMENAGRESLFDISGIEDTDFEALIKTYEFWAFDPEEEALSDPLAHLFPEQEEEPFVDPLAHLFPDTEDDSEDE